MWELGELIKIIFVISAALIWILILVYNIFHRRYGAIAEWLRFTGWSWVFLGLLIVFLAPLASPEVENAPDLEYEFLSIEIWLRGIGAFILLLGIMLLLAKRKMKNIQTNLET